MEITVNKIKISISKQCSEKIFQRIQCLKKKSIIPSR